MRKPSTLLCGLVLLAAAAGARAADIWVHIAEPSEGSYVLGDVEIVAEVATTETVEGVEFRVDGRSVGMVTSPPFRMRVDLGADSTAHHFEVVARTTAGGQARDSVTTLPVPIAGRIDVELQQLYVTVNLQGRRVLDLKPEDFVVLDEGTSQQLVTFEIGDVPLTAVLLIDSSSSMAGGKLQAAIGGAMAFVEEMEALDRAKLMLFADRLQSSSRFTAADGVDLARLATTRAAGGTALFDHLFVALKLIEQRQGRRVVILLSDGVDSHSTLDMNAVSEVARRSQAQIHWIRLRRGGQTEADDDTTQIWSAWRSASENRDQLRLLKQTVTRSGGAIHPIDGIEQVERVFLDILQHLREQYVLGYYPSNRRNDGEWHRVRVRVARQGVQVQAAEGYIDF